MKQSLQYFLVASVLALTASAGVSGESRTRARPPEVWLGPPIKRVMELVEESSNADSSLEGIAGLKLYIDMMNTATPADLGKLAALVRRNNLKVIVEVGGTLNYDWQDQAGEMSAEVELAKLKRWHDAGGTMGYLDLDDPIYRLMGGTSWGNDPTKRFVSYNRCAKELMDYLSVVKKVYPEIQFYFLTNFPNWGYKKGVSYHGRGPHRNDRGDYHEAVAAVIRASKQSGMSFAGSTVGNPYDYLTGTRESANPEIPASVDWIVRIRDYEGFCGENGWEFNLILNSEGGGKTSDRRFHEDTLNMIALYQRAGGRPARYFVQSWYEHPQSIVPCTEPFSMTALAQEVMKRLEPNNSPGPNSKSRAGGQWSTEGIPKRTSFLDKGGPSAENVLWRQ